MFVRNSVFDGQHTRVPNNLFSIKLYATILNISIWDSLFVNHHGFASLFISDRNSNKRIGTYISLRNIRVENYLNAEMAAVSLSTTFKKPAPFEVEILNSAFKNNSAALHIGVRNGKQENVYETKATVIYNNTFTQNFDGQDLLNPVPAIYLYEGKHQVTSSRFYDNKAEKSPFAAVLTVSQSTFVTFTDCYFENRQTASAATQFYARAHSTVHFKKKNIFNTLVLNQGQAIFTRIPFGIGTGLSIKTNFKIPCPKGYILKTQKTCKSSEHVMTCTYMYITCEKCPPKTYALERSQFIFNSSKNIKCTQCPRGGNCVSGVVKALPNFWGYKTNASITFAQCPPEYCCSSKDCVSYNSCHGNRTGTLCGRCPVGMSDSLFGSQCTPNTECSMSLFIPGAVAMLVAYLIFFLYHEQIVSFVKKSLFGSLEVFRTRKKNRYKLRKQKKWIN